MADKEPYGDVKYADPGYQSDGKKRYPLNSEAHCRAAWTYINVAKNAAKYTPEQLKEIKDRIKAALEKYGVETADDTNEMSYMGGGRPSMPNMPSPSSLIAGAAPLAPPAAWFSDPSLKGPTKLSISEDGHVFGHLAQWKVCHVGIGSSCVMAPKTRTNYQLFRVGTVVCDDGSVAPIGKITLGTGHANERWGIMPSREHYDNTGWAAAVVNVGEDKHGIWVNGALTTTMTPEKVAEFRAAALSGDWRSVNGNLELIAALAVNNPGFPVYREQDNRAFSLMAVGVVGLEEEAAYESEFSVEDGTETETPEFPADDVMDDAGELAARLERWREIDEDLDRHNQDRRAAALAAIDKERMQLDQYAKSGDIIFAQSYDR
jgi:hypothetical protein